MALKFHLNALMQVSTNRRLLRSPWQEPQNISSAANRAATRASHGWRVFAFR